MVKLKIMIDKLYRSKWKTPSPKFKVSISDLTAIFYNRFEDQLNDNFFVHTQNY